MNYYDLIKVGEKFLAKKKILRPKYESIRKLNLHKMDAIPVCKIPK